MRFMRTGQTIFELEYSSSPANPVGKVVLGWCRGFCSSNFKVEFKPLSAHNRPTQHMKMVVKFDSVEDARKFQESWGCETKDGML